MASNRLGDIPGAKFPALGSNIANSSVASNGANAVLGYFGPFPYPIRVRDAWWQSTAANNSATSSVTYRQLTLRSAGTAGTGSTIVASMNLTATVASLVPQAMTVDTTQTVPANSLLFYSHATVGGTDATDTVLVAGQFQMDYEVL